MGNPIINTSVKYEGDLMSMADKQMIDESTNWMELEGDKIFLHNNMDENCHKGQPLIDISYSVLELLFLLYSNEYCIKYVICEYILPYSVFIFNLTCITSKFDAMLINQYLLQHLSIHQRKSAIWAITLIFPPALW